MFSTCVLSAFQSLPIPSSCVAKTGETPQTNPLPPPVLKPTNQQKGASGLCPPLTFPADISTPPCRHPQNSLPLLRQTAHPVPGGHFQRPLVPTGGPRACPNCPQGPGPRTSRPLPPAPRHPGEAHPQPLDEPPIPHIARSGPPQSPGRLRRPPQRGVRAREAPAGRAGRLLGQGQARAPSTDVAVGAFAWRDRAPASPPGWRVAGKEDRTGQGAAHLPRRDGDSARLRLPARGHSSASRARSEYIPSSGGPGRRGGPRAGPGSTAPATPPLSRSDEWLPAPGGAATARPATSAPRAPAARKAPRGRGLARHSFPGPMGTALGVRSAGGPAPPPRRAADGERCALRQLEGGRPEAGSCLRDRPR